MKKLKILIVLIGIMLLIMTVMFSNVYAIDSTNEELNFKDPNLQKAMLEMVGKTQKDKLTMADIEKYLQNNKGLSLMDSGITDLTGLGNILEKYKVEWLYLNNNKISDISELSKVKSLKILLIFNNNVQNFNALATLTELESLDASNNNISDLSPLNGLNKMNSLILDNNNIRDISIIQNFPNLEVIKMDNNQIEDISVIRELKKLSYISFSNNKIKDISCMQVEAIVNSSDNVNSGSGFGHVVTVDNNYIDFSKPENKQIIDRFKKSGWNDNFEEQDGDVFKYMPQKELPVTAIIDIVDKEGKTQAGAGEDDTLYSMIDVPTGSHYGECYYQLYLKSYVGKSFNVNGLGTFNFEKKDNVSDYGEQYIYKCKIANPDFFYKAGIKEYSVTYTVEASSKTYTTKFKIKVTGLEVKTYEVKADKKIAISLTGAMGNNSLEVNTIDKENRTYVEMVSMFNIDKENMDIYAYDINVQGQYEGELTLTFNVGQEYNGRKAGILHIKKDNTTEKFEEIVENGKVTVKVNGLSPFMIAIENTNNSKIETPKEETKKEHKLDETPKTGTTFEVASILSIIALITISGIVITNKYKK